MDSLARPARGVQRRARSRLRGRAVPAGGLAPPALCSRSGLIIEWQRRKRTLKRVLACCSVSGALGEIRTPDPRIRSPMLYPAELRARAGSITRLDRVGPAASDQSPPGSKRASSASRWPSELATNLSEEFLSSRGIGDGPVQYSSPNPERKNWSMD